MKIKPGYASLAIPMLYGTRATLVSRFGNGYEVYRFASSPEAEAATHVLRLNPAIALAVQTSASRYERDSFVPNDPYFSRGVDSAGQWYLKRRRLATVDADVSIPWAEDITGRNVALGIVDDGIQTNHPDLAANYDSVGSRDFGQNDLLPNPVSLDDNHGTAVAGLAAAVGGNAIGISGAAPEARVSCQRIDFQAQTNLMFAQATVYRSTVVDPYVRIKNHSYGYNATYIDTPLEVDAILESADSGTIHVNSAGNGRGYSSQDSSKKNLPSLPDVIAVSAVDFAGKYSWYSNFGANVFVCAPSSSNNSFYGISSTDRGTRGFGYNGSERIGGNYTETFGGTSAAAPIVTGVLALVKEVRPDLSTRLAKHLMARTSTLTDRGDISQTSDQGWSENAAGFRFNQNYGFGIMSARKMVNLGRRVLGVTPLSVENIDPVNVDSTIPDANEEGVTKEFALQGETPLEQLMIRLDVEHTYRGDLEAFLESPSGTRRRLFIRSGTDGGNDLHWNFLTNAFWGEIPKGVWKLTVRDVFGADEGTWLSFAVHARMGELIDRSLPLPPSQLRVSEASATTINLRWIDNSDRETGFEVQGRTWQGTFETVAFLPANATSAQISHLSEGIRYQYRVRSLTSRSSSRWSNTADETTLLVTPPVAPRNMQAVDIQETYVTLQWEDASDNESAFIVQRSLDGSNFVDVGSTQANETVQTAANLTPDTRYWWRVVATRGILRSIPSNVVETRTAFNAPVAPQNLRTADVGENQMTLLWDDASNNETAFLVQRSLNGSDFEDFVVVGPNVTTQTVTGLVPDTQYWWRIIALRSSLRSSPSNHIETRTAFYAPRAPENLRTVDTGENHVSLQWDDVSDNETGFRIEKSVDGANFGDAQDLPSNTSAASFGGLSPNTTYWFRVRSLRLALASEWSPVASATTLLPVPAAPAMNHRNVTAESVEVFFESVLYASFHEFEMRKGSGNWSPAPGLPNNWNLISGLDDNTPYTFRSRAGNARGWSAWTERQIRTLGVPPRAPSELKALNIERFQLDLAWKDNSDNEDRFIVHFRRPGQEWQYKLTADANDRNVRILGLNSNTVYQFRVRAQNEFGDSAWSNVIEVRTRSS